MSAETIFFNIFILFFIWFIFNRYIATQRIMLLGVLFGQFFSFITSFTAMINNVKTNLLIQVLTSFFGIIVPGIIFFMHHFYKGKEVDTHKLLRNWMYWLKVSGRGPELKEDKLLLGDGSHDTYGLIKKVKIISEKCMEDLLKGYNCPMDEIPSSVKNGLEQAQSLFGTKSYRKILEIYTQVEKQCGDNAVLQFNIGNMYYNLKDYTSAVERYNKALTINENFEKSGRKSDERSIHRTAARRIKNILKKVEDYEIVLNMAVCYLGQGRYEKAIETFRKAGELKGNWINIYQPLATVYEALGRNADALEMYKGLAEVNPDSFEFNRKVAEFLCRLGSYMEAKEYYDKAVQIKPDYIQGYIVLGNHLIENEMYKEAIKVYEEALKIDPNQSSIHYNLGIAFYNCAEEVKALGEYKKAIELNESDYMSYYNLGVILDELGQKEDAILAFENCLDIKPDFYEASNNIAVVLCSMERYKEAIDTYVKALQYNPFNHELYFNLAVTLECQQQDDQAEELYTKIIKMKPDFADAYFNLAAIKCNKGDLEGAKEYLEKVLECDGEYHKAYYQLARVYAMSREYGRCIESLKKAVSLSVDYVNKASKERLFDSVRKLKAYESIFETQVS